MQMWAVVDLVIGYIDVALLQLPRGLFVASFATVRVIAIYVSMKDIM